MKGDILSLAEVYDYNVYDPFDSDHQWSADSMFSGVIEVQTNTSSLTQKKLAARTDILNTGRFVTAYQTWDFLVINSGAADFTVVADSGDPIDILGNPVVPAGTSKIFRFFRNLNSNHGLTAVAVG